MICFINSTNENSRVVQTINILLHQPEIQCLIRHTSYVISQLTLTIQSVHELGSDMDYQVNVFGFPSSGKAFLHSVHSGFRDPRQSSLQWVKASLWR
jgi:hypothetical protein